MVTVWVICAVMVEAGAALVSPGVGALDGAVDVTS
jgi:hypothetical protein